ncbi:MBL fold metallo-hydrolase [Mycobacterium sp. NPDC050441]|uniref:MBL fold metallo-hydrolase n=1 Tax=Mycobacterium sp. NPDC050441 TaxID=3155403 RepID=UPI003408C0A1
MKVHHLNCGTMHVPGATLVCHVLLAETSDGLVLVDTGFGTHDCADPARRIGPYRHVIRPALSPIETAAHQITALGFDTADVRHIVLTHFDLDHIGGLADFPDALVHVTAAEARGAVYAPSVRERVRYRRGQWAHGPRLVEHTPDGEAWRGFTAVPLESIGEGIVLISLPGHTRGHAAVAVDAGNRWVLHAGDAFYHPGTLDGRSRVPAVLRAQEALVCYDRKQLRDNQERLAELYHRNDPGLLIVCSHDPGLYAHAGGR